MLPQAACSVRLSPACTAGASQAAFTLAVLAVLAPFSPGNGEGLHGAHGLRARTLLRSGTELERRVLRSQCERGHSRSYT